MVMIHVMAKSFTQIKEEHPRSNSFDLRMPPRRTEKDEATEKIISSRDTLTSN